MFNGVSSNWKGTVGGVGYRGPGCYAGVAGVGFFFVCVCAQIHLAGRQGERAVACRHGESAVG